MSNEIIPIEELPVNPETGYRIPPDGVTVSANGAGYMKGHKGIVYPSGTFGENGNAFNHETSMQAIETKRELKELRVREAIEKRLGKPFAQAYGEASGALWEEIVLNPEASGRTRFDVMRGIGEEGGLIDKQSAGSGQAGGLDLSGLTPQHIAEVRKMVETIIDAGKQDLPPVIDGEFG